VPNLGNGLVEPEDLVRVSVKVLYRYLTTNEVSPTKAKVAVTALSAVGRIKATERMRDATQFSVAKAIANNQATLQKYVAASLPHLNPVKKLARSVVSR
jgi:cbb3-type cytochrome oxidase cytochrome c subunit